MTIHTLCQNRPTLIQYEILQRADVLFGGRRQGRYYGAPLTKYELDALVQNLKLADIPTIS